jgi:hypothetical protein
METDETMRLEMSPGIGSLAAALAKAQGEMEAAGRDRTAHVKSDKGNYSYNYATLAGVWEACRAPLAANGLAVIQTTRNGGDTITVRTLLAHASNEWIAGELTMRPAAKDPQSIGSALTYARKYALAAMVGIAADDEDDDGAAGSRTDAADTHTTAPRERAKYEGSGAFFKFGKLKGKSLSEGTVKDLSWYAEAIRESVDNPEKAQYRDANRKHLEAVEAERAKRTGDAPAEPETDAPPPAEQAQITNTEHLEHWRGEFKDAAKEGASSLSLAFRKMQAVKLAPEVVAQLRVDYEALSEKLRQKKGAA